MDQAGTGQHRQLSPALLVLAYSDATRRTRAPRSAQRKGRGLSVARLTRLTSRPVGFFKEQGLRQVQDPWKKVSDSWVFLSDEYERARRAAHYNSRLRDVLNDYWAVIAGQLAYERASERVESFSFGNIDVLRSTQYVLPCCQFDCTYGQIVSESSYFPRILRCRSFFCLLFFLSSAQTDLVGCQGLVDPHAMRCEVREVCERGIRPAQSRVQHPT